MNILCVGDCGVDNYSDLGIVRPGGISLNVAVHARKLLSNNDRVGVVGVIGNDKASKIVKKTCLALNIENYLEEITGLTPVQHIKHTAKGEKIFTNYEAGVLEQFVLNTAQQKVLMRGDLIMSPLFTQIEPLFQSVIKCQTKGQKAGDFGSLEDYDKNINVVKKYVDKLQIAFFGLNINDQTLINQLRELSFKHKVLIVITLGGDGSIAYLDGLTYQAKPSVVEKVIDTTGAGDAFSAAFMSEYLISKDVQKSLTKGNRYASEIVQQLGSF